MQGEYKVYEVDGKYQIFWCPSAPVHYNDRIPYDGRKLYSKRQAAYRRCKQLNEQRPHPDTQPTLPLSSKESVPSQSA